MCGATGAMMTIISFARVFFEGVAYYDCCNISQLYRVIVLIVFMRCTRMKQAHVPYSHASFLAFAPRGFGAGLSFFSR